MRTKIQITKVIQVKNLELRHSYHPQRWTRGHNKL